MTQRIVVVGAGHAAGQLVDSLRREGYRGAVTLVGEEPVPPYQRPPLSKQYLAGAHDLDWLLYRPREFYAAHGVDTRLGRRAVRIDREGHDVELDDGTRLRWDKLALTTGCRIRPLPVSGAEAGRVHYLRTIADVDRIRARLGETRRVVIVGAGFIGLEVAAVLAQLGREVTVLEAQDRVLPRVVAPLVSEFFRAQHAAHGVCIRTGVQISRVSGGGSEPITVACGDGTRHEGELVLAGIGVLPNVELAAEAGLACDDGIVVDECARTSDEDIVAAGDCTRHPNALLGRQLRLETVHNAVEQAKSAAAALCGREFPYRQIPWVWSDQYGLRLQAVGATGESDQQVLRGAPGEGRFSLFYFERGRLTGVNCVNRPADFGTVRRLLNAGIALTPAQAADPGFDPGTLVPVRAPADFEVPWPARAERVHARR